MLGLEISLPMLWTILAIVFAILEGITLGLTTMWFAIGSIAALIVALLGGPLWLQVIVFVIVSIATIALARPLARNILKVGNTKTNVDSIIGKIGIVHEPVQAFKTGQVKVNGQIWTAKAEDDGVEIEAGTKVVVLAVDGVKLIIKQHEKED